MLSVIFKVFRAIDEPELCEKFIEGHRKVLEIYNIAMITSNKAAWTTHKNTYVILAESKEGKALGGVRVQIADDVLPLPIEDAVGKVDKNIYGIVKEHKVKGTGEFCGLWNSREIAGYGIGSFFLCVSAVALAINLNLNSLFALCAPATVRMCKRFGLAIERSLGKNGYFNYPRINLVATAMSIKDLKSLKDTQPDIKKTILSLIENPIQTRVESGPKGQIRINYQLKQNNHI